MVEKLSFGSGFLYRITDGPCSADILPYGAALRALRVPGRDGGAVDVVLGYDSPDAYRSQDACLGAVVGRYANRIAGARFTLGGQTYRLLPNEGPNTLHSGAVGFQGRMWELAPAGDNAVVCTLFSPDGEEGFPGDLTVKLTYTLAHGALTLRYDALAEADTVLNLTNHAYFNLAGHAAGRVDDHVLTLRAARFTPSDAANLPTGELRPVAGTPWDLRTPTPLSQRLSHPLLEPTRGFDHNFVLDAPGPAAQVFCPRTGITLEMDTDRPGVQLYTAGWLTPRPGKEGAVYGPTCGFCLETQNFPNAVNTPAFPSPLLPAHTPFTTVTTYRFHT